MSKKVICLVDNSEHDSVELVHKHLRKFKIKVADYYEEYYKRYDLYNREPIKYKNFDQYFSQDFNNKNNIKKFIKASPDEAKQWTLDWLVKRKTIKGAVYAFSQVELKTLACPSMHYYDSIGGYYDITGKMGFKERYKKQELVFKPIPKEVSMIQDTREQKPIKFKHKTIVKKLDCGDYGIDDEASNIYVERKSLSDFIGTLAGKNLERFERELQRAKDSNSYVVMVVESKISQATSFDYLPHINRYTRLKPSHVFKNLRDLLHKFPLNFQAVFVEGRTEAANKITRVFELGNQVKDVDLQFYYEKGDF